MAIPDEGRRRRLIGLLVIAAIIFLPRLLGGGDGTELSPSRTGADARAAPATERARRELEQIVCGANEDVQDYWTAEYPAAFGEPYEDTDDWCSSPARTEHRVRPGVVGDRAVLLPGRRAGVHRPRLPRAAAGPVRRARRPGDAVHRRPRVRPPRPEPERAERRRRAGDRRHASGYSASPSSCRPTATPGRGPTTLEATHRRRPAADRRRARSPRRSTPPPPSATTASSSRRRAASTRRRSPTAPSEQREGWFRRGYATGDPAQCDTFAEV